MKNIKKIINVAITVIILSACHLSNVDNSQSGDLPSVVDFTVEVDDVSEQIDISPLIENDVKIVKLETTDECLISDIRQVDYVNGLIYIADKASQTVLIFDESGKYVGRVGKRGEGPGEYSRLGRFQVVDSHIYIMDDAVRQLYDYDLKTRIGIKLDIDDNISFDSFYIMNGYLYLLSNNSSSFSIGSFNLFKYNMKTADVVYSLPFSEELSKNHSTWGLLQYASRYDDELLVMFANNDTIYSVTSESVAPRYVYHFSKRFMPAELRKKDGMKIMMTAMDKRYILGFDRIVNLKNHFIVKYGDVIVRSVLYDKRTDKYKVGNWLTLGDLGDFYMFHYHFTDNNEMIVMEPSGSFLSSWETIYSKSSFVRPQDKKRFEEIYNSTKEDDNPIVVLAKVKK
ncbi:6-bladed beta-propeller [Bacteroides sp.]|uniref:6-bladed beta-propeller n=1 Tax=Bacteroides sp. TaxID=29523 RepID=UPI0025C4568E|nr:6-bladed beta-propeller [Bacteroides sp.]